MLKRKFLSLFLSMTLVLSMFSTIPCASAAENTEAAQTQSESQIKNFIFMIPDGGGDTLMDLANMVKIAGGFDKTKYPNATHTGTEPMTVLSYLAGYETTRSANSAVTDSAAGGTALSSGYKTNNGYVGIDTKKVPKATILEVAQSLGKATGIVSTAEWPHATPASYTAHAETREDYYNIYKQIENKELNVVLGAGYGAVTEFEGATIQNAIDAGYKIIKTPEDAASVVPGDKLWGNVTSKSLPSDINNSADKASLPELTEAAITALSGDEDGFFLMVESSNVDGGGHSSNAVGTTSEYLSFDAAWTVAVDFAKGRTDTIVIGAPDHDTGGMDFPAEMTDEIALIQQGTNPSTFTWTGNGAHTARNCPVWVYLPEGVEMIQGLSETVGDSEDVRKNYIIDNTAFAPYMAALMGTTMDAVTEELFVDVTTIGAYMPTSNRFIFNNGDKYIYTNTDTYYKDGEAVDMHGKVAVYLGGKFYVPAEMVEEADWDYVNVEDPDTIEGSGTAADPYVIDSESDYTEFLIGLAKGASAYDGKYIRQDCDLTIDNMDLAADGKLTFSGIYDGNGHKITWDLETDKGVSVFPLLSGTVYNLGVDGKIKSSSSDASAGIAYNVLAGGKIVNCYSNVDFEGASFYGVAVKNQGVIHNTYYGGNATVSGAGNAISDGGTYTSCYYVKDCGLSQLSEGVTEVSDNDAVTTLAYTLEGGRAKAEDEYGLALRTWAYYGAYPVFESDEPVVTGVRLYPETQTVAKGDKFQFTANVDGKYDYSWEINWSIEPQSELSGTFIDKRGVLHIDENETITSFTVMAKSKANGAVADASVVTVGDVTVYPEGNGTKEKPYLITSEEDFYNFTQNVIGGNQYKDTYFKQTIDLDMAGYPGYSGMGSNGKFYGTYDGAGHIINVNITGSDGCLFGYTWGTIMNLGSTGSITNSHQAAGIARSLRSADGSYGPGKLLNCWSSADIAGTNYSAGIVPSNSGFAANCYFTGSLKTDATNVYAVTAGNSYNNFYANADYSTYAKSSDTLIGASDAATLHQTLNAYRAEAAELAGIDTDDLVIWTARSESGAMPYQVELIDDTSASVQIKIYPENAQVAKGSGAQLAVSGNDIDSSDVTWTIETADIADGTTVDGYGYITIDSAETNNTITVKATLKTDATVYATAIITVTKSAIPDGSKDNPYIIASEADFLKFTNDVIGGEKYKDTYFLQTADLDMAGVEGYVGMGSNGRFYGTYNGGGHVINVELETYDGCLFGYTWGTIINLGSTGYVRNEHSAGGIARSLRVADGNYGPGKIANCWSSAEVSGNFAGGIVPTGNTGTVVINCYATGSVTLGTGVGGAVTSGGCTNCYFVNDSFSTTTGSTKLTEAEMKATLHTLLNSGIADAAIAVGADASDLITWKATSNNPVHDIGGDDDPGEDEHPLGSKENPYIIASEADFLKFTNDVIGGEKYAGKYFLQTADLDMAGVSGYAGMGQSCSFYGIYNGGGHKINVALESGDQCLFPYTYGIIMNLGSTGYVRNEHSAGGIARSLRAADDIGGPGMIVNCWSSAEVSGNYAGGIVPTGKTGSLVANCFATGNVTYVEGGGVVSSTARQNCYFVNDNYSTSSTCVKLTEAEMKATLHTLLNNGIADVANAVGVAASDLITWKATSYSPVHDIGGDEGDDPVTSAEVEFKVSFGGFSDNTATVVDTASGFDGRAVLIVGENQPVYLEEAGNSEANVSAKTTLEPGTYTFKIRKPGYITYSGELTVNADGTYSMLSIPELIAGDIKNDFDDVDGDGIVDIDDFIRILRGFSYTGEIRLYTDINCDGAVNVSDLAIIKNNFGKSADSYTE